jgi:hypothetical protein
MSCAGRCHAQVAAARSTIPASMHIIANLCTFSRTRLCTLARTPTTGVIFQRCGCRDTSSRRLEQRCPRLDERRHGSWYFHTSATNLLGRSERAPRGDYPSQTAARRTRDAWLASTGEERTARSRTVQR